MQTDPIRLTRGQDLPLPWAAPTISHRISVGCPKKWAGLSKFNTSP